MREFGAQYYGGDLSKWPSKVVDIFILFQEEHSRVENIKLTQITTAPKPKASGKR